MKTQKKKKEEEKKVIIVGHSLNDAGGLSFVASELIKKYLSLKYFIGYINISPVEMNVNGFVKFGITTNKCHIINCNIYDPNHKDIFDTFYKDFKCDLVITLHDPWLLDHVIYSIYRNNFYWVAYQTFETNNYPEKVTASTAIYPFQNSPKSLPNIFKSCDLVIPCSKGGCESLKKLGIEQDEHIYLGTNIIDKFQVDFLKSKNKSDIFGSSVSDDDFIFATIGVNNQRKKLDKTLEAFAKFVKSKNYSVKYKLYLHSDLKRNFNGTDIIQLIKELKIAKNVIIESTEISKNLLYDRLAVIDCYISLHGAEGFGLPFIEAMMFDKPCIYTNYSTPAEYCDPELGVSYNNFVYAPNFCLSLAIADTDHAVNIISKVVDGKYKNKKYGYDYVEKNFNIKTNIKKFIDIVKENYSEWKKDDTKLRIPIKRVI